MADVYIYTDEEPENNTEDNAGNTSPAGAGNIRPVDNNIEEDDDDPVGGAEDEGFGAGDDDMSSVSPLMRLIKCAQSDNYFDRQMVARSIHETLRHVVDSGDDVRTVLKIMTSLTTNEEAAVRTELMEQVPQIAVLCHDHPEHLANVVSSHLVPLVVQYLTDPNNQVRKTSQAALLVLLEQSLVRREDVHQQVCPVLLDLTCPEAVDDFKTEAVALMSKMAPLIGREMTENLFLGRFTRLCSDSLFQVRKVCASNFGDFCNVVSAQATEELLVSRFVCLCEDGVWGVRKACAEVFMGVSCACSIATRRHRLAPVFVALLGDQSRWVRVAAFQNLGPFISTFAVPAISGLAIDEDGNLVFDSQNSIRDVLENSSIGLNTISREGIELGQYAVQHDSQEEIRTRGNYGTLGGTQLWGSFQNRSYSDKEEGGPSQIGGDDASFNSFNYWMLPLPDIEFDYHEMRGNAKTENNLNLEKGSEEVSRKLFPSDSISNSEPITSSYSDIERILDKLNMSMQCLGVETRQFNEGESVHLSDNAKELVPSSQANCDAKKMVEGICSEESEEQAVAEGGPQQATLVQLSQNLNPHPNVQISQEQQFTVDVISDEKDDMFADPPIMEPQETGTMEISSEGETVEEMCPLDDMTVVSNSEEGVANQVTTEQVFQPEEIIESNTPKAVIVKKESTEGAPVLLEQSECRKYDQAYLQEQSMISSKDLDGNLDLVKEVHKIEARCLLKNILSSERNFYDTPEDWYSSPMFSRGGSSLLGGRNDLQLDVSRNMDHLYRNLNQDIVPKTLLEHYIGMTDPVRAETVDNDITRQCAYSLPAVALTLGRHNWPMLKDTYDILAGDMHWKVRRTLAFSIHELGMILGGELAQSDLVPVFNGFIKDLDEVRIGVLKHLAPFLRLLQPTSRRDYLPRMDEFLRTDNENNWRFRYELATQLGAMIALFSAADCQAFLAPIALALMADKVVHIRHTCFNVVCHLLHHLSTGEDPHFAERLAEQLVEQFARANTWSQRQSYAFLCGQLVRQESVALQDWCRLFLPSLLLLGEDRVPNVRLAVAKVLASHVAHLDFFQNPENDCWLSVQRMLEKLDNDADRDVRYFASHPISLSPSSYVDDVEQDLDELS